MPCRGWVHRIALGGCLVGVLLFTQSLAQTVDNDSNGQHEAQKQAAGNTTKPEYTSSYFGSGKPVDTDTYRAVCEQPKDVEHADLCQQWRMAEATKWQLWLTGVGLAFITVTLFFTGWAAVAAGRAANAAMESNRIAREIGQAESRAYLAGVSGSYQRSKEMITGTIIVKNHGQSPAREVKIILNCSFFPRAGILMAATGPLHEQEIIRGPVTIQAGAEHKFFFVWQWKDAPLKEPPKDDVAGAVLTLSLGRNHRPSPERFHWAIRATLSWRDVFRDDDWITFSVSPSTQPILRHPDGAAPESGTLEIRPS